MEMTDNLLGRTDPPVNPRRQRGPAPGFPSEVRFNECFCLLKLCAVSSSISNCKVLFGHSYQHSPI